MIKSSESSKDLSHFFWFFDPATYGDSKPILFRCNVEQFGVARSGRVLELAVRKFPGQDAKKIDYDDDGLLYQLITNHSFVDNFICAGNYKHGNNRLTTSLLAGKMQQLFLKYNLKLTDRVDSGMGEPGEHISFGIRWESLDDEITPYINLNVHKQHPITFVTVPVIRPLLKVKLFQCVKINLNTYHLTTRGLIMVPDCPV